ncbi:DUF3995 domain-containing protein [Pinisolibacter aquiterrae]|uniref:DUF3995 domain-containing protein n=1 Tax=Pinisolibacter aquiterrae TaxID=2815579 RepID=UPI001C3D2B5F|nr:DUF3995 domain-containing protein [Pinisolibacter aquiterrae]MBV5262480.1 DUF3995 domain-containing protein [Pinisolibacter aquiterrae]MCC8235884.1 DUF3995 domain-containing protein [Pinisolibacter aquiterrae]
MIAGLAVSIFVVLTIVALLHAYWAFGGRWPGHDEPSLARMVVGSKGITAMPARGPTLAVAVVIFLAGVVALARVDLVPVPLPPMLQSVAVTVLAVVFLGRGIASFTPWFRASQSEEPFATLDRRLYGPLCLASGTGFAVLVI